MRLVGVLLAGAAMALILLAPPAATAAEPLVQWDGADFTLAQGDGWPVDGAHRLAGKAGRHGWLLLSPPIPGNATDPAYLRYRIEGLGLEGRAVLLWPWSGKGNGKGIGEGEAPNHARLPFSGDGEHLFRLESLPEWRGDSERFALLVEGDVVGPVIVHEIALMPAGLQHRLAAAWTAWTALEDWSGSSINLAERAPENGTLRLLPVLAMAIALGVLGYTGSRRLTGRRWHWQAVAVLFLCGWLVADGLWQRQLFHRLDLSLDRYAGKRPELRLAYAPDGALFGFLRRVRASLPPEPQIVHLLVAGPDPETKRYLRYRSQYHLRPHNLDAAGPPLVGPRPGDYIVVIGPVSGLHFAEAQQRLTWRDRPALRACPILTSKHGALYEVLR